MNVPLLIGFVSFICFIGLLAAYAPEIFSWNKGGKRILYIK